MCSVVVNRSGSFVIRSITLSVFFCANARHCLITTRLPDDAFHWMPNWQYLEIARVGRSNRSIRPIIATANKIFFSSFSIIRSCFFFQSRLQRNRANLAPSIRGGCGIESCARSRRLSKSRIDRHYLPYVAARCFAILLINRAGNVRGCTLGPQSGSFISKKRERETMRWRKIVLL